MERVKERLNALRLEADEAQSQVEELKTKIKELEEDNLAKQQEITSLTHQNQLLEQETEKLTEELKEAKAEATGNAEHGSANEGLQRRVALLEEEAEQAEQALREANDKYVAALRDTDVKAGAFERQAQAAEAARDEWETKYEEMAKKYNDLVKEQEELEASIGNI
ncbi:hypothetical protein KEM52_003595 [Ascosphaera acerosa]|nr:hypothetical protein KEM52_003595 [Ascosphaera acerosa]